MSKNLFEIITTSLNNISIKEKVELFKQLYSELAGEGTCGDTELAHINAYEASVLRSLGGSGTLNEVTGIRQYGGGDPPQAATNTTQSTTTEIPAELKPYVTDILGQSQAIEKQRLAEGYKPYQGQQIADFTPEQRQAFSGVAGLVGSGQQYFDAAKNFTNQAATAPTAEMTQQFMSPYMQNVVAIQQREAARVGDVAAQELAGKAARQGAFGGSRQAILEAEGARNLQTQFGDIQAKGLQSAYGDAQTQMAALANRQLQASTQMSNLGNAAPAEAAREFAALSNVGQQQQQQGQQALDISMNQYNEERTFPERALQNYSSIIRGFPLAPSTTVNKQEYVPQAGQLQQLAGLGLGAAAAGKAFNVWNEGGSLSKNGKGLHSIVVKRSKGSKIVKLANGSDNSNYFNTPYLDEMQDEFADGTGLYAPLYRSGCSGEQYAVQAANLINRGVKTPEQEAKDNATLIKLAKDKEKQLIDLYGSRTDALVALQGQVPPELEAYKKRLGEASTTGIAKEREDILAENTKSKDALKSQNWLELAKVGLNLAAPKDASRGFLGNLATAAAGSVDKFGANISAEAELAKQQRKELSGLTDKEFGYLKDQTGLSMDELKRRIDAKKTELGAVEKLSGIPLDTENVIRAGGAADRASAITGGNAMANLVGMEGQLAAARAKAAKEKGMTAADLNAFSKQAAQKHAFVFDTDTQTVKVNGTPLDPDGEAYRRYAADLLRVINTFERTGNFTLSLEQLKTATPAAGTVPPPPEGSTVR